ncbi:MAG TPA: hypothetical protein VK168_07300 [Saprospiraceae bacterium]|nr:hypothetical protein [Saprospiraceae bacterium]
MGKIQLFAFCILCTILFAGCDQDPNCSGLAGPPTEELLSQFGGLASSFGDALIENDGNFYHFKSVKKFGDTSSHGLLSTILREPLGSSTKLAINGVEIIRFSPTDGHSLSSESKSSAISQAFGTNATITQYYNENTPFFSKSITFPQEIIVTSPIQGTIMDPFYKNTILQWTPGLNISNDVYIVLLATNKWPVVNNSIITPLYKVIKTSDTGSYQFQPSDFVDFPTGIKFVIYVSRGTYELFSSQTSQRQQLIIATTTARGIFTLADVQ